MYGAGGGDSGIVDEYVDATEAAVRLGDECRDIDFAADICAYGRGISALGDYAVDDAVRCVGFAFARVVNHDRRALRGECHGHGTTDA